LCLSEADLFLLVIYRTYIFKTNCPIGLKNKFCCLISHLNGGLLWMRWWTSGFRKKWRISWLTESLLVSQVRTCSVEKIILHGWEQSTTHNASVVVSRTHLHVTPGR
jgi:hypothetical protein